MKLDQIKCDECGKVHPISKDLIEVRKVFGLECPQIERRDAPAPLRDPPGALFIYDFCDLSCMKMWASKLP